MEGTRERGRSCFAVLREEVELIADDEERRTVNRKVEQLRQDLLGYLRAIRYMPHPYRQRTLEWVQKDYCRSVEEGDLPRKVKNLLRNVVTALCRGALRRFRVKRAKPEDSWEGC